MFSVRQFQNKPVIDIENGKQVGTISDLYLGKSLEGVKAVYLGAEGFISRRSHVIDISAVQVCGADAWLVHGAGAVVDLDQYPDREAIVLASDVKGRAVQTDGGTKIGVVDDVLLDGEAQVVGFHLGRVFVQGPVSDRRQIARAAISNVGSAEHPMITLLQQAESLPIPEG